MNDENSRTKTLRWSGMTDKGRYRANNEDAFLALTFDSQVVNYLGKIGDGSLEATDYVFAVSDGMGGAKSGEFASKIAVEKITRLLPRAFKQGAEGLRSGFSDVLVELYESIHKELLALGKCYDECSGMGATLSLCWFTPEWLFFGHIGDSRIYYFPHDGPMKQLTDDHSFVGWQRRQGQLTEREARNHPRKSILTKSLGAGHQYVEPQVGAVGFEPGDKFLICSDGIVDGLWDSRLESLSRESTMDAPTLIKEALDGGSRDNVTALLIEMVKHPHLRGFASAPKTAADNERRNRLVLHPHEAQIRAPSGGSVAVTVRHRDLLPAHQISAQHSEGQGLVHRGALPHLLLRPVQHH